MLTPEHKQSIRQIYSTLKSQLDGFLPRQGQNQLIAEVAKVIAGEYDRQRRILVAEAGTGTGKSLAYLIGALPLARAQKKTLVVSTATVALQEQLFAKDLPLLQRITEQEVRFALVKGRQRYCCEHKLESLAQADLQAEMDFGLQRAPQKKEKDLLKRMHKAYLEGKWQGDRDSWPSQVPDPLWQMIQSDRHSCSKALSHHRYCPFHRARQELEQCHILVVNHALLLADLRLGGGVILPPTEDCIFVLDEAHHLDSITRDQFSPHVRLSGALSWTESLQKACNKYNNNIPGAGVVTPTVKLAEALGQIRPALQQLHQFFTANSGQFAKDGGRDRVWRFQNGEVPEPIKLPLATLCDESKAAIGQINRLNECVAEAMKLGDLKQKDCDPLFAELGFFSTRLETLHELSKMLISSPHNKRAPDAKWCQQSENEFELAACPLEVGGLLEQSLWSKAHASICVSATLTALSRFDHFRHQVGLRANDGTQYRQFDSPFDFKRTTLRVPSLSQDPQDAGYANMLIQLLPQLLDQGNASLVLFTSYRQMEEVADALRSKNPKLPLMLQGETSRHALLKTHRELCDQEKPSVLFGTSSFAEGLDLPGKYLDNLVITRLPFAVPTSPFEQAQAEWISDQGGNPFMQVTVPEASRKLVQACGRLMRKETDSGYITLLDRRILTKRYGKALLDALPPFARQLKG